MTGKRDRFDYAVRRPTRWEKIRDGVLYALAIVAVMMLVLYLLFPVLEAIEQHFEQAEQERELHEFIKSR